MHLGLLPFYSSRVMFALQCKKEVIQCTPPPPTPLAIPPPTWETVTWPKNHRKH